MQDHWIYLQLYLWINLFLERSSQVCYSWSQFFNSSITCIFFLFLFTKTISMVKQLTFVIPYELRTILMCLKLFVLAVNFMYHYPTTYCIIISSSHILYANNLQIINNQNFENLLWRSPILSMNHSIIEREIQNCELVWSLHLYGVSRVRVRVRVRVSLLPPNPPPLILGTRCLG